MNRESIHNLTYNCYYKHLKDWTPIEPAKAFLECINSFEYSWYFEETYNIDQFLKEQKDAIYFGYVKYSLSEEDIEELGLEE